MSAFFPFLFFTISFPTLRALLADLEHAHPQSPVPQLPAASASLPTSPVGLLLRGSLTLPLRGAARLWGAAGFTSCVFFLPGNTGPHLSFPVGGHTGPCEPCVTAGPGSVLVGTRCSSPTHIPGESCAVCAVHPPGVRAAPDVR